MPNLIVQITEDQAAWLNSRCNRFNTKARLIRDLIDTARYGLDMDAKLPAYCVGAEPTKGSVPKPPEARIEPEVRAQAPQGRSPEPKLLARELEKFEELVRDFWRVKKGSKGDRAWSLLNTELKKIQDAYGDDVVEQQLQLAINGGWKGITLNHFEAYKPQGTKPAQRQQRELTDEEKEAQFQESLRMQGLI